MNKYAPCLKSTSDLIVYIKQTKERLFFFFTFVNIILNYTFFSLQVKRSCCSKDQTSHPNLSWRFVSPAHRHRRMHLMIWMVGWFLFLTGTCVNNTSVMMFKKGSFETKATIYPVAIKVLKHFVISNHWLLVWSSLWQLCHQHRVSVGFERTTLLFTICLLSLCLSMTLDLVMLSGTAASTTWSATCCAWWPAGP